MASGLSLQVTILDFPEILDVLHEALDAVPEWERRQLRDRLAAILWNARAQRHANRQRRAVSPAPDGDPKGERKP